jgi:hypothetical protein
LVRIQPGAYGLGVVRSPRGDVGSEGQQRIVEVAGVATLPAKRQGKRAPEALIRTSYLDLAAELSGSAMVFMPR